MQGVISEINLVQGRGLIQTGTGQQILFTKASLHGVQMNELGRGRSVTCEIQLGFEGPKAVGVRPSPSQHISVEASQRWSQSG